ncbi:MAG: hypothetical protein A2096_15495 [Spirochaetes bacterium GWF1_41_5]|nr:MAG: hypothetical protein A2096_15495 [Spirochaetes bacterium GWF1_41_5]HBE01352.1 hypothetical protein [Spirochaetia bacterium]
MIKVIKKAIAILEYISEEPLQPRQIKDICRRFKLNQATCSHIIKTLLDEGYVEKSLNGVGYLLGIKPYQLVKDGQYFNYITALAKIHLHELANEINESVVLNTIKAGKLYTVYELKRNNAELEVKFDKYALWSIYLLATGRVLLAFQTPEDLEICITENGLPREKWNNINNAEMLKTNLEVIKKTGYSLICEEDDVAKIGFPIIDKKNKIIAAVGTSIPQNRFNKLDKEKLIGILKKYSEIISSKFG